MDELTQCWVPGLMIVEVLNTGTELLLGEVVNTHAAWIGKRLFPLGLRISRQTTVPDGAAIRDVLIESFGRADVVFVTGGLGPTTDDITREVVAELLGLRLVEDATVAASIKARLEARRIPLRERMLRQTMVPEGSTVLPNDNGTAPGLYVPAILAPASATPHLFLLPGPPRELQPMFDRSVVPLLGGICGGFAARECRIYRVVGMGESEVEEAIGLRLTADPQLEVGYCARPNEVDLRVIGSTAALDASEPGILRALGDRLVSRQGERLEEWIVKRLIELHLTVATAESCSGGLLAHRLTNVPGASAVFRHGFVTYANAAKSSDLGVDAGLISTNGAVSETVAAAMAEGALLRADADFALALTGIAGPDGGTPDKPVGLVFIALARRGKDTIRSKYYFPTDRETFKQLATQTALDMLRREILAI